MQLRCKPRHRMRCAYGLHAAALVPEASALRTSVTRQLKQLRCSERVPVGMQLRCKPRHRMRCA